MKEMDCKKPKGSTRFYINCAGFDIKGNDYIDPESFIKDKTKTIGYDFMATANTKHHIMDGCDKKWYADLLETWIATYVKDSNVTRNESIEVMIKKQLGSPNSLLESLKAHQYKTYPFYNHCLTTLLYRNTPTRIGFDLTFDDAKDIGSQHCKGVQTTLTIVDDLDHELQIHLINGKGEGREQIGTYLIESRLKQLLLGDPTILNNIATIWFTDKHLSNKNTPEWVDERVEKWIQANENVGNRLYDELINKLKNINNPIIFKQLVKLDAECLLHLFKRVYANLKEDGVKKINHKDCSIFTAESNKMYVGIQKGESNKICSHLLTAEQYYYKYENQLRTNSEDIICVWKLLLKNNGIRNINERHSNLIDIKKMNEYKRIYDIVANIGNECEELGHE
eukprot:512615_1